MEKMTTLSWTRRDDGYHSGRFFIQRHHVDDRDFDGGYVHTYWNLLINGEPYQQHTDLASAKRDAERLAAKMPGTPVARKAAK